MDQLFAMMSANMVVTAAAFLFIGWLFTLTGISLMALRLPSSEGPDGMIRENLVGRRFWAIRLRKLGSVLGLMGASIFVVALVMLMLVVLYPAEEMMRRANEARQEPTMQEAR